MLELLDITCPCPQILTEGFSAYKSSQSTSTSTTVTGWSVTSPSFSSSYFNAGTGIFTVPISGIYAIQATISYVTDAAISAQLGSTTTPTFAIRRFSPTVSNLIIGFLPVFYTNLLVLSLRTLLSSSTVTLAGVLQLTKNDTLGIYYDSNSLVLALALKEVRWTAYRLE